MVFANSRHAGAVLTRRDAVLGAGAAVLTGAIPAQVRAAPNANFHDEVASRVRELSAGQQIELNLLLPDGASGNLVPILEAFQSMTGVRVHAQSTGPEDINTMLLLDNLSGAHSYDVALPATFAIPELVSSEAILPLSTFAQHHEPTGFRDNILFTIGDSFDGELYGFQTDGDAYLMFYHKDMLEDPEEQARYADRHGKALARPDTWEEVDRQLEWFHRPDEGQCGGLLFRGEGYLPWEWWIRFHAKGVWPFSEDMEPQIASDAGVAALEEMIRATQYLCPDVAHLALVDNWERYGRGDIYCNIGWGGSQKYLNSDNSAMRNRMVYGPTPGGIVDGKLLITPYFNWGWNYVVLSETAWPEIAYLFTLFASTPEMSTRAVRKADGFFDPFRPEHYNDKGIQSTYSSEFLAVHKKSMKNAIPDLYLKDQAEYFRVLGAGLARALAGDITPEAAMTRVAQQWQLITDGADREIQMRRWKRLRVKYPVNIRMRLKDIS